MDTVGSITNRIGLFSCNCSDKIICFDERSISVLGHTRLGIDDFISLCHPDDINGFSIAFRDFLDCADTCDTDASTAGEKYKCGDTMSATVRMKRGGDYVSLHISCGCRGGLIFGALSTVDESEYIIAGHISNAQKLQSERDQLENDLAIYGSAVEKSPISFAIVCNGTVVFVSEAAKRIVGLNQNASFSWYFADTSALDAIMRDFNRQGVITWRPVTLSVKGEEQDFLIQAQFEFYNGAPAMMVWLVGNDDVNISGSELELANEMALRNALSKSQYIADMGHEVRTPMNAILGLSDLLKNTDLTAKQSEYIGSIASSAKELFGVVNNIMDFACTESGKIEAENIVFKVHDMLLKTRLYLSEECRKKILEYELNVDADEDLHVVGNPIRLNQVLDNIIANAAQFTHKGKVTVGVTQESRTDTSITYRFSVCDTGVGMSKNQVELLFAPLSANDGSVSRKYGGSGISLMICKNLIDMMGGRLWCESVVDEGSSFFFTVTLPIGAVGIDSVIDDDFDSVSYDDNDPERNAGVKILVVEDIELNRTIFEEILRIKGYRADFAVDGQEAVRMIDTNDYDIVFMDIRMPVMDGLEATRRIRENARHNNLPIIAMTAHATKSDYEKSIKAGMNGHLTKPIEFELVYKALRHWVHREVVSP